ncbi:MAG: hypothetical protein CL675_11015 [Bdellovibrionaceae bacterium]|nr:hypothetical protein [Pseudobdellovibrionaceae bacterium]
MAACLISLVSPLYAGLPELKNTLSNLHEHLHLKVLGYSSVYLADYQVDSFENIHDIRNDTHLEALAMVMKYEVTMDFEELYTQLHEFQSMEQSKPFQTRAEIRLLSYEDRVMSRPSMHIPHPELIERPDWLVPAGEVWPDFDHPILKEPLKDLAGKYQGVPWGRFYAQGKSVLEVEG